MSTVINVNHQKVKETVIYYESWQMDCCGIPFSVGDYIEMPVQAYDFGNPQIKPQGLPLTIEYAYNAHGEDNGRRHYILRGRVKKIFVEYCDTIKKGSEETEKTVYIEADHAYRSMPEINIEDETVTQSNSGKLLCGKAKKIYDKKCDELSFKIKTKKVFLERFGSGTMYSGFIVVISAPDTREVFWTKKDEDEAKEVSTDDSSWPLVEVSVQNAPQLIKNLQESTTIKITDIPQKSHLIAIRSSLQELAWEAPNIKVLLDLTATELKELPMYAFIYCDSLFAIKLPQSIAKIGAWAFSRCYALKKIYFTDIEQQWADRYQTISVENPEKNAKEVKSGQESAWIKVGPL